MLSKQRQATFLTFSKLVQSVLDFEDYPLMSPARQTTDRVVAT